MKNVKRTTKMVVVTDASGEIVTATWPGEYTEGAPSETGVSLHEDDVVYEVDVPQELYESARPDLSRYTLSLYEGRPTLVPKGSPS